MGGYIGTTKRDIEYLIDSVMEPGVSVKREVRTNTHFVDAIGVNIIYHFYKNGDKLFSVCILPKGDSLSNDLYQMKNLEVSILCGRVSSDFVCKDDDGFRSARVLCQLAERMYKTQKALKKLQEKQTQLKEQIIYRQK